MIITDPDRVSEILTAVVEDPTVFDMFVTSPDELAEQLDLTEEELEALHATEELPQIFDRVTTSTATSTGNQFQTVQTTFNTSTTTSADDSGATHTTTHEVPTSTSTTVSTSFSGS